MPGPGRAVGVVVLVASCVGLAAGILSLAVYTGVAGYCPGSRAPLVGPAAPLPPATGWASASGGCEVLYSMPEARILGVHLSVAAPLYFALAVVLSSLLLARRGRLLLMGLLGLYSLGLALVPYLVYLEVRSGAFCPYCTAMHACILVSTTALGLGYRSLARRS